MIRISDIVLEPGRESHLTEKVAGVTGIGISEIQSLTIVKKSLDARKKNDIHFLYTVDISCKNEKTVLKRKCRNISEAPGKYVYTVKKCSSKMRPVVVGFGPSGMFAALILSMAGLNPIVLERGSRVESRIKKVNEFISGGSLDTECNVQFGEGGAGTFSDGKLTTGKKNERIAFVLEEFYRAGAPENIMYDSKPHVGTDVLVNIVKNIREKITANGGEIRFDEKLTDIELKDGRVTGIKAAGADGEYCIPCDTLVLAIGHSARDTFEMLHSKNIPMQRKAFSIGARIEHRQSMIDESQFGKFAGREGMPHADYKLVCHLEDRSVYTFCMCPGGEVIASASETGGVVTNGMSLSGRNAENANAAVLVSVVPDDFPGDGVLAGMYWQRDIEQKAFVAGGNNYFAVAQKVGDFLDGTESRQEGKVKPSYRPGVRFGSMESVLPEIVTESIKKALPFFDWKIRGFASDDAVLTAPETRSSSPVRILRNANCMSEIRGLYPAGEGAGYAGGIMSSCVDGMLIAESILNTL